MPLVDCRECGEKVSTEASSCPKCGAKVRKPKKSRAVWYALGVIMIVGIAAQKITQTAEIERTASLSPEQKAAEEKKKSMSVARTVAAKSAAQALKKAARDPDSLKIETVRVSEDAAAICVEYRARNGFGGMNKELMVYLGGVGSQDVKVWNKNCTKNMFDMLYAIK